MTITDIWTKYDRERKYHTVNTPEWPNSYKLKIQDGGGRHLKFQRNVNKFELDRAICAKFGGQMHHGHAEMTHDQNSKPELFLRDVIIMTNKDVYIKLMSGT